VGEIALVDDGVRTATVAAKTPVVVEVIGRREFKTLLDEEPEIGDQIRSTAAQRKKELEADDGGNDRI
jgi:CRP-like cAMP-binding protein